MALQPDGKIVVAGEAEGRFALARYNENGTLDTSFGGTGVVTNSFPGAAYDVVLQPDGKIVVAGTTHSQPKPEEEVGEFAVARYNENGTLDASFGGTGMVSTSFNPELYPELDGLVLQPNGKIVVAGTVYDETEGEVGTRRFALARFNEDGGLDTTFGTNGKVITQFGSPSDGWGYQYQYIFTLAREPGGKLVAGGMVNFEFALARYNENGTLDTSFGEGGLSKLPFGEYNSVSTSRADAIVFQPDGKIVAAGAGEQKFALARFNANGSLDTSFGSDGQVTTSFPYEYEGYSQVSALQLQSDGRIVAAGAAEGIPYEGQVERNFALVRYNPNGALDKGFGNAGLVTTAIGDSPAWANALAIQPDGKLIAAGESGTDFALARYEGGGPPPPAYQRLSVVKTGTGSGMVRSIPAAIACGTGCSAEYVEGEAVTLEASPNEGSEFSGWTSVSGNPGTCTGSTNPCKTTLSEAVELTAGFAAVHHAEEEGNKSGGGGGNPNPSPAPTPTPQPTPTPIPHKKPLNCRKGFKKHKVHGKSKCVKGRKKRHG